MWASKSFWRELFLVLIVSLGTIICGCMQGWPGPTMEKLRSGHDIFNITSAEGADLALYAEIGHFVAPIPGGLLADYFGRKPMFAISASCSLIGWAVLIFANTYTLYAVARVIIGFGFAVHCVLMIIYIAEISSKSRRGAFSSSSMFTINIGILLQFGLANFLTLRATNALTFGLCILQVTSLFFLRESPYFLVASNQKDRARSYLSWLRATDDVDQEFSSIKERVEARQSLLVTFGNLFSRSNYKGFLLCMVISSLSDLTGRVAILIFAAEEFKQISPTSSDKLGFFLALCNVLFPLIPIFTMDRIGRKAIIIISSVGIFGSHVLSGLVFLLKEKQVDMPRLQWLLFASLASFLCCHSMCVTGIFALRGEIISENSRGLASGFSSMAVAISIFVSTKSFQLVSDQPQLGTSYAFWLLASFSAMLIIFTLVFIPETKNKNFEEIQHILYKRAANQVKPVIQCSKM